MYAAIDHTREGYPQRFTLNRPTDRIPPRLLPMIRQRPA